MISARQRCTAQNTCRVIMGLLLITVFFCPTLSASPAPFPVCTDYHCDVTTTVSLTEDQWQAIRKLFQNVHSAAQERQQIRAAIARLETEVGTLAGTHVDLGGNPPSVSNEPGQLDCIAESKNTHTYLTLLAEDNLLQWHTVEPRHKRALWFFLIHWTAVIQDKESAMRYAVDSWYLDNGEKPYVQMLQDWLKGRDFE